MGVGTTPLPLRQRTMAESTAAAGAKCTAQDRAVSIGRRGKRGVGAFLSFADMDQLMHALGIMSNQADKKYLIKLLQSWGSSDHAHIPFTKVMFEWYVEAYGLDLKGHVLCLGSFPGPQRFRAWWNEGNTTVPLPPSLAARMVSLWPAPACDVDVADPGDCAICYSV